MSEEQKIFSNPYKKKNILADKFQQILESSLFTELSSLPDDIIDSIDGKKREY